MSKKHYTPNDQRSMVKNPNNSAYTSDINNRVQQGQSNVPPPPAPGSPKPDAK